MGLPTIEGIEGQKELKMDRNFDPAGNELDLVLLGALKSRTDSDLIAWLQGKDETLRVGAAFELQLRGGQANFEALLALSHGDRHEKRAISARVLGQFGTPECKFAAESWPVFARLLIDPYFEVRAEAIYAMGHLATLGNPLPDELTQGLVRASFDAEPSVREAVAYSCLSVASTEIEAILHQLADDRIEDVRDAALFSLEARGERRKDE